MEAQFLKDGVMIDYTPSSAVAAGEVVTLGRVCLVAPTPIAANTPGALAAAGVFRVEKTAGLAINLGDGLYFNSTTRKITKTSTDVYFGVAVKAALADDATVDALLRSIQEANAEQLGLEDLSDVENVQPTMGHVLVGTNNLWTSGKVGGLSVANNLPGVPGLPLLIRRVCTATGAEDVSIGTVGIKCQVIDAWLIARDTNAANVKLHKGTAGTDDITDAKAKGTTDNAIVRFGSIVAANATLDATAALWTNFSAAGSAEICILAVPVE